MAAKKLTGCKSKTFKRENKRVLFLKQAFNGIKDAVKGWLCVDKRCLAFFRMSMLKEEGLERGKEGKFPEQNRTSIQESLGSEEPREFARLGNSDWEGTSREVNIIELEVEFVVTTLRGLVDDGDGAVVVVSEADLHLGGTFHGEANAAGDARLLAVDRQLIVDVHLSGGDIRPGDLDLLRQLPVGGLIAGDVALKWRADDLPLLVLDVNLVHAAGFRRVGDVHAAVLVRVEVDVRLGGAWNVFKG